MKSKRGIVATENYKPSLFRMALRGVIFLPIGITAIAGLLVVGGAITIAAGCVTQFLTFVKNTLTKGFGFAVRSATTTPALLELHPGFIPPVALLTAFLRYPKQCWIKVIRHLLGYRVGYTSSLLPPLSSKNKSELCAPPVCRLEVVEVNGAAHVVRLRGNIKQGNVMLILHGGPGATDMLSSKGGDKVRALLEKNFVVVDYDQRSAAASGCLNDPSRKGIQSMKLRESLTIVQHVEDAVAIAVWLKSDEQLRLPLRKENEERGCGDGEIKLHLLGGSWGSQLALRVAEARPDLFISPVVVRGLVVDCPASEKLGCAYLEEVIMRSSSAENPSRDEDLKQLRTLTGNPENSFEYKGKIGTEQIVKQRQLLEAYGGMTYSMKIEFETKRCRASTATLIFGKMLEAMKSEEYSLESVLGIKHKMIATLEVLGLEVFTYPPKLAKYIGGNLDVVVAHGVHDHNTDAALVAPYLSHSTRLTLDTGRKKKLIWFQKSGHSPHLEEPEEFAAMLGDLWLGNSPSRCSYPVNII